MSDSDKLDLILQLLSDIYETLGHLAPLVGVKLVAPEALERWRKELNTVSAKPMQSPWKGNRGADGETDGVEWKQVTDVVIGPEEDP